MTEEKKKLKLNALERIKMNKKRNLDNQESPSQSPLEQSKVNEKSEVKAKKPTVNIVIENNDYPPDQVSSIPKQQALKKSKSLKMKLKEMKEAQKKLGINDSQRGDSFDAVSNKPGFKFIDLKNDEKYYIKNGKRLSEKSMAISKFIEIAESKVDETKDKNVNTLGQSIIKKLEDKKFVNEVKKSELDAISKKKESKSRRESYKSLGSGNSKISKVLEEQKIKRKIANEAHKEKENIESHFILIQSTMKFQFLHNKPDNILEVDEADKFEIVGDENEKPALTTDNQENLEIFGDGPEKGNITIDYIDEFELCNENSEKEDLDVTIDNIESFDIFQSNKINKNNYDLIVDSNDFYEILGKEKSQVFRIKKNGNFEILQNELNESNKILYSKKFLSKLKNATNITFEMLGIKNNTRKSLENNQKLNENQFLRIEKDAQSLNDEKKIKELEKRLLQMEEIFDDFTKKNEKSFNNSDSYENKVEKCSNCNKAEKHFEHLESINSEYIKIIKKLEEQSKNLIEKNNIYLEKLKTFQDEHEYTKEKYDRLFTEYENQRKQCLIFKQSLENNAKTIIELRSVISKLLNYQNLFRKYCVSTKLEYLSDQDKSLYESLYKDPVLQNYLKQNNTSISNSNENFALNNKSKGSELKNDDELLLKGVFKKGLNNSKSCYFDKQDYFAANQKIKLERDKSKQNSKDLNANSSISSFQFNEIDFTDKIKNAIQQKKLLKLNDNKGIYFVKNMNKFDVSYLPEINN